MKARWIGLIVGVVLYILYLIASITFLCYGGPFEITDCSFGKAFDIFLNLLPNFKFYGGIILLGIIGFLVGLAIEKFSKK